MIRRRSRRHRPGTAVPRLLFAALVTPPLTPASLAAAAAACFASPTPAACREALVRGDALVVAGRDRASPTC
jgi:hypothetical protein